MSTDERDVVLTWRKARAFVGAAVLVALLPLALAYGHSVASAERVKNSKATCFAIKRSNDDTANYLETAFTSASDQAAAKAFVAGLRTAYAQDYDKCLASVRG